MNDDAAKSDEFKSKAGADDTNEKSKAGADDTNEKSKAGADETNAKSTTGADDTNAKSTTGNDDMVPKSTIGNDTVIKSKLGEEKLSPVASTPVLGVGKSTFNEGGSEINETAKANSPAKSTTDFNTEKLDRQQSTSMSSSTSEIKMGSTNPSPSSTTVIKIQNAKQKSSTKKRQRRRKNATVADCRIGFLGSGKLSEAIVKGFMDKGIESKRLFVASKNGTTHDTFKNLGCKVMKRSYDLFSRYSCDVIFLCVHGPVIRECYKLGGIRPLALTTNYIPLRSRYYYILSMVTNATLQEIRGVLLNPEYPKKYRCEMHRCMLNTAVIRGAGLGCIDAEIDSKHVSPLIRELLFKIAKVDYYPEAQMDILCAVGGNGLAFVYYLLGALADGAFKMGLAKRTSIVLAAKTMNAAALCLLESGKHASDLRDSCTSPSGPAIYGIAEMEKRDTASGITQAIEAAFKRIREVNLSVV